jgi:hypothetical protein
LSTSTRCLLKPHTLKPHTLKPHMLKPHTLKPLVHIHMPKTTYTPPEYGTCIPHSSWCRVATCAPYKIRPPPSCPSPHCPLPCYQLKPQPSLHLRFCSITLPQRHTTTTTPPATPTERSRVWQVQAISQPHRAFLLSLDDCIWWV